MGFAPTSSERVHRAAARGFDPMIKCTCETASTAVRRAGAMEEERFGRRGNLTAGRREKGKDESKDSQRRTARQCDDVIGFRVPFLFRYR